MSEEVRCYVCGQQNASRTYRHFVRRDNGEDRHVYTCLGDCADTVDDAIATINMFREEVKRGGTQVDEAGKASKWRGHKPSYSFADDYDPRAAWK